MLRILLNLIDHETIWSKAHRHISSYFQHMAHIIKWQDKAAGTSEGIMDHGRYIVASSISTLTTNIIHSKGATITIKYSDDMEVT